MAAKRVKSLTKAKRVKAVARKRVGSPKPARLLAEKAAKPKPKYKARWQDALGE